MAGLEGLKAGDFVTVIDRLGLVSAVRRVERLTKLHAVVGGRKYRRESGIEAGDSALGSWSIRREHPGDRERLRRRIDVSYLCSVRWGDAPPELVSKVAALVREAQPKGKPSAEG